MFATPKRHILARNRVFRHILRQNPSRSLGCSELQPPSQKKPFGCAIWRAKSRMRGKETPGRIVTNFCTGVGVHDVITSANFYDSRVRGLSVVGVKFWASHWLALSPLQHSRTTVRVCDPESIGLKLFAVLRLRSAAFDSVQACQANSVGCIDQAALGTMLVCMTMTYPSPAEFWKWAKLQENVAQRSDMNI